MPGLSGGRRSLDNRELCLKVERSCQADGSGRPRFTKEEGRHGDIDRTCDPCRRLLELFFQIHDPSTLNRQGNDRGTSYRSAIYYTSDEQKRVAQDTIADVDASGLWPGKVVTELAPSGDFWQAEPEHQDYLERYPDGYTCHFIRPDWKLPSRAETRRAG